MACSLPCRVSRAEALRYLGYAGQSIDPSLDERLQAALSACEAGKPPAGVFAIFPLERCGGEAEGEHAAGEAAAARKVGTARAVGSVAWLSEICERDSTSLENVAAAVDASGLASAARSAAAGSAGSPGALVRGAGLLLPGEDIVRFLEGATHCALMAVTLGAQREQELQRRTALSATDALLYDAACSALAEAAADALQERVAQAAAGRGLDMLAGRFSPGYGDLPLDVQKPLLAALDAYRALGLAATESCLLVPRKSVTAVVGLRPAEEAAAGAASAAKTAVGEAPVAAGKAPAATTAGESRAGDPSVCNLSVRDSSACSANRSNSCDLCAMADRCAFRRPVQERNPS